MKKIYTMLLAGLALCAVSCQEGPIDPQSPETETPDVVAPEEGQTMTFTASFGDTKVALGEDGLTPYWENNDAITIYDSTGDKAIFRTTLPEGEKAATATFQYDRGLNGDKDCPTLDSPYYAVYGHLAGNSNLWSDAVQNVQIWKDQSVGDHYTAPMIANSKNTILNFKNAAALLKFTVNADNVQSVSVVTDVQISGEGSCGADARYNRYLNEDPGFKQVTLRGKFEKGQTYHIVVAPTTVNSLKMYVNGDESHSVVKELSFARSNIYDLGTVEQNDVKNLDFTFYLTPTRWDNRVKNALHIWGNDTTWENWYEETDYREKSFNGLNSSRWIIRKPATYVGKMINLVFSNMDDTGGQSSNNIEGQAMQSEMYYVIPENQRGWDKTWTAELKPVPEGFTF